MPPAARRAFAVAVLSSSWPVIAWQPSGSRWHASGRSQRLLTQRKGGGVDGDSDGGGGGDGGGEGGEVWGASSAWESATASVGGTGEAEPLWGSQWESTDEEDDEQGKAALASLLAASAAEVGRRLKRNCWHHTATPPTHHTTASPPTTHRPTTPPPHHPTTQPSHHPRSSTSQWKT